MIFLITQNEWNTFWSNMKKYKNWLLISKINGVKKSNGVNGNKSVNGFNGHVQTNKEKVKEDKKNSIQAKVLNLCKKCKNIVQRNSSSLISKWHLISEWLSNNTTFDSIQYSIWNYISLKSQKYITLSFLGIENSCQTSWCCIDDGLVKPLLIETFHF